MGCRSKGIVLFYVAHGWPLGNSSKHMSVSLDFIMGAARRGHDKGRARWNRSPMLLFAMVRGAYRPPGQEEEDPKVVVFLAAAYGKNFWHLFIHSFIAGTARPPYGRPLVYRRRHLHTAWPLPKIIKLTQVIDSVLYLDRGRTVDVANFVKSGT